MQKILQVALLVVATFFASHVVMVTASAASEYCQTVTTCKAAVQAEVKHQNIAASSGKRWGPPSGSACEVASREQEGNEKRCRAYDKKSGGKTLEECAKCYRQVVLDIARWELCFKKGYAPRPPKAIYESLARLGKSALALQ